MRSTRRSSWSAAARRRLSGVVEARASPIFLRRGAPSCAVALRRYGLHGCFQTVMSRASSSKAVRLRRALRETGVEPPHRTSKRPEDSRLPCKLSSLRIEHAWFSPSWTLEYDHPRAQRNLITRFNSGEIGPCAGGERSNVWRRVAPETSFCSHLALRPERLRRRITAFRSDSGGADAARECVGLRERGARSI